MKQQVVEITDEGVVRGCFPLTEEIESVEWMPGVIVLLSESQMEEIKNTGMILKTSQCFKLIFPVPVFRINTSQCFNEYLQEAEKKGEALFPYLFYPFDFTSHAACRRNSAQITAVAMATIQRLGCLLPCRIIGDI